MQSCMHSSLCVWCTKVDGGYDSVDYYVSANMWNYHFLTPKFDMFILAPKSVSDESLAKLGQQIPKISC